MLIQRSLFKSRSSNIFFVQPQIIYNLPIKFPFLDIWNKNLHLFKVTPWMPLPRLHRKLGSDPWLHSSSWLYDFWLAPEQTLLYDFWLAPEQTLFANVKREITFTS